MSTTADLTSHQAPYHVELIDGREIEKPLPKKLHSLIERYLILALSRLLPLGYIVVPELNILTGGRTADGRREYVVPDLVVVDRRAKYEDGDLSGTAAVGSGDPLARPNHWRLVHSCGAFVEAGHAARVGHLAGETEGLGIFSAHRFVIRTGGVG